MMKRASDPARLTTSAACRSESRYAELLPRVLRRGGCASCQSPPRRNYASMGVDPDELFDIGLSRSHCDEVCASRSEGAILPFMSAPRFELIKAGIAAMMEGNYDGAADMFAVDAEVQRVDQFGIVRGREAIRKWLAPDAIEPVQAAVTALEESGDHVLATCHLRIRGTGSGVEVANTLYVVFTFRGRQVSRMEVYFQRAEAAAAAGLGAH
jgi:ketosteroid isomerase-like protein